MKRKQTRFTSEKEIIERIDELNKTADDCLKQAIELDAQCKSLAIQLAQLCDDSNGYAAIKWKLEQSRRESERVSKQRNSILYAILPRHKGALAAMRTEVLPFTNDRGVVLS